MEYGKIIAVTGLPGLFELVSSKNDGAIVRALDDKTTKFVSSRVHNFSHLESIEVFTTRDNVNLADVFNAMAKSADKLPDEKDNKALKGYFENVFPDLDFERVYTSDLKKMVKWYSVLKENNIEIKLRAAEEDAEIGTETPDQEEDVKIEEPKKEKPAPVEEPGDGDAKPAKVSAKKKAAPKAEKTEEAGNAEEKPAKKTARKKKTEE